MDTKVPEKPEYDNVATLSLPHLGITIEEAKGDEREMMEDAGETDGNFDPDRFRHIIDNSSESYLQHMWEGWMETCFSHRYSPVSLFSTGEVEVQEGITADVVKEGSHGNFDRPVLKQSERSKRHILDSVKTVCIHYALESDKPPVQVADELPIELHSYDIMRIRRFVDEHTTVWVTFDKRNWWNRSPLSDGYDVDGFVYFMYVVRDGVIVPRYIGICRKRSLDGDGLNWAIQNAKSESVMTRWGYGKGQHLGELSCAMWEDSYSWDPKPKYERWLDELFVDQTRVLREPVYLEVLPWVADDPLQSEENLVRLASEVFDDSLLNVEFVNEDETMSKLSDFN